MKNKWIVLLKSEKLLGSFSIFTIGVGVLYFCLETWYHFKFGQSFIQLLADYISVFLLLFAGFSVLKNQAAKATLCGAWGFAFCMNYRAFAWRMDEIMRDNSTILIDNTAKVLCFCLLYSFLAFVLAMLICYPFRNHE